MVRAQGGMLSLHSDLRPFSIVHERKSQHIRRATSGARLHIGLYVYSRARRLQRRWRLAQYVSIVVVIVTIILHLFPVYYHIVRASV